MELRLGNIAIHKVCGKGYIVHTCFKSMYTVDIYAQNMSGEVMNYRITGDFRVPFRRFSKLVRGH